MVKLKNPTIIAALISATVAILVIVTNYKMNKRSEKVQREIANQNIDANVAAKARLKWIEEVRKLTTELISNVSMTNVNGSKVIQSNEKFYKIIERFNLSDVEVLESIEEIACYQAEDALEYKKVLVIKIEDQERFDKNQFEVFAIAENLILYFSPQEEHTHIVDNIEWLKNSQELFNIKIKDKNYKEAEEILHELNFQISEFKNNMRWYLKQEWERAKQGK